MFLFWFYFMCIINTRHIYLSVIENENVFDINLIIRFIIVPCLFFGFDRPRHRISYFIMTVFLKKNMFLHLAAISTFRWKKGHSTVTQFFYRYTAFWNFRVIQSLVYFVLLRKINIFFSFCFAVVLHHLHHQQNHWYWQDDSGFLSCFFLFLFYIGYGWTNIGLTHQLM